MFIRCEIPLKVESIAQECVWFFIYSERGNQSDEGLFENETEN